MGIGFDESKAGLNQKLGSIAASIAAVFSDVDQLIVWAAQNDDAALTALGFTAPDVQAIRTYVADATNWRDTTYGQRAQTPATNFLFNIMKARKYI